MKKILIISLLIASINGLAQNYTKYMGKIGNLPITFFIKERDWFDSNGDARGVIWEGFYYYNKVQQKIKLKGSFDAMGMGGSDDERIDYIWEYVNGTENASFQSRDFAGLPDRIKGIWSDNRVNNSKSYNFYLIKQ